MKESLEMIISWFYPILAIALIVVSATRGNLRGKAWLIAHLGTQLFVILFCRLPPLLKKLEMINDPSTFYQYWTMPVNIIGLIGFGLLIPFVLAVSTTGETASHAAAADHKETPMTVTRALFSFSGRLSRDDYWLKGFLPLLPVAIINNILAYGVGTDEARAISMAIGIICLWPSLALASKRLHDRNRSAWFLATTLIPIANIVFGILIIIEIWFLRGTVGPNRFGNDPAVTTA